MTEQGIVGLGPAFSRYLASYRPCFGQARTAAHFDTDCRGLLTDLPRKSVEPIARQSGTAVRTRQEFLVTAKGDQELALDSLQRRATEELATIEDAIGTVGLIDETSCRKWGDQTPGVQRTSSCPVPAPGTAHDTGCGTRPGPMLISASEITHQAQEWLIRQLDKESRRHIIFMERDDFSSHAVRIIHDIPLDFDSEPSDILI
jgi:hypothetical protein